MAQSKSGLSRTRLQRLGDVAKASADRGEIAGLITVVERRGEAISRSSGWHVGGGPIQRKR